MKANELMIGDWVFCTYPSINKPVRVAEIKTVGDNKLKIVIYDDDIRLVFNETYIDPIPITPEILEKNGFDISDPEVKQYHFEEDGQRYHFTLRQIYNQKDGKPNGYSFFAFNVLTIIDYVHQLQHSLKLVGIDKEIEL